MKSKIEKLSKKPFVRNVIIVATGTAAAQAITMAFAPFITRLYGPEAYGVLGVFMSMVGIIAPVAALTYPISIVLPKSDKDAKRLVHISLYIAVMMATIATLILVLFNKSIVSLLQIEIIAPFLYLIPLVILFSAFLQVIQQWLIRTKQFRITAKVGFLNALILNTAKVGFGWFNPVATVLIILTTLGSALHGLMLAKGAGHFLQKESAGSYEFSMELAKKHRDFPLFRAPQVFINAFLHSLPILLLSSFFGPASAGFYSIGKTVLAMPTSLIGKSVGDVFYPRIVKAANNGENLHHLIIKATMALAGVGIIPFAVVVAFGPWLFGFVFGEDWVLAGEYAKWLALWSFFGFINRPSIVAIPVLRLQGRFLIYEIISLFIRGGALFLGVYYFISDIYAVAFYSLAGVALNILLIIYTVQKSSSFYKNFP